ncbi:MAG: ATP-binding cassette domain-containing protein [Treponema sp.]|nr:ATP-binding cassette domain-containing protein [Treponema sp.]
MNILSINNLSKIGREQPLFTGVTFGMDSGDKAAIIGRNGTGKSTLLATIAGVLQPDEGSVVMNKSAGVSYLAQNPVFNADDTIRDHIFASHDSPKLRTISEYEAVCAEMAQASTDGTVPAGVQQRYDALTLEMDKGNLWNYEAQVQSILGVLGIHDMSRKMGELSGGMVKKVALAQVLVEDTKLLLLDEPTNHLDISTIYWLQNYLRDTDRCVLMVTHDRYFLDAVCNNIYELARSRLKLYQGNYSTYLEKKAVEAEIEANTERRIESVLRFERDWLMRGPCARGTKAKARIQRDMQLINREKFEADKGFQFEVAGRRLGGKILELHNISKSFRKGYARAEENESAETAESPVLRAFSYTFSKGEKIGIFGDNGSGKSTLLNIITGSLAPDSGTIVKGENTVFGYYQQNPVFKDLSLTVLDYIKEAAEVIPMNDGKTLSASQFLNEFGFEGKIQHSMLSTLSGGERKRVFLVRLLIANPNFLILDEPTNDFDIFTMNILEDFLMHYKGCLLIVSHDRYFMDKVADTLFVLEDDGSVSGFVGKCSEYLEVREERKRRQKGESLPPGPSPRVSQGSTSAVLATPPSPKGDAAAASSPLKSPEHSPEAAAPAKPKRLSFKEQKEFEQLEERIAELESRLPVLEAGMADSDYTKAQKAGADYSAVQAELEKAYARWEELAV